MEYKNLERVIEVIKALRDPITGCPWDLEQSHESLVKYLIEESYEYIEAVELGDSKKMEEELGDVFLQVLLNAQIASEDNKFNIDSISKVLADKMIHRHPHVFGENAKELTAEEVTTNWKKLKGKKNKYFINISDAYAPALLASSKIGAKSQDVNFDWDHVHDVIAKVDEELEEVKVEIKNNPASAEVYEEIGDLLFSVAQLARHLNIDPEQALKDANLKFINRINKLEDKVKNDDKEMTDLKTSELEDYWAIVKKELKETPQD